MSQTSLRGPAVLSQCKTCLTALAIASAMMAPAQALTINASFDSVLNSNPTAKGTILDAVSEYQSLFSDPITVNVLFKNSTSGLGQSSTWMISRTYSAYLTALAADSSSAEDAIALSYLPATNADPAAGNTSLTMTLSNARAVGLATYTAPDGFDSTIRLNLSLMNSDRIAIDPNKYDLRAVAQHELDEVLGTVSGISMPQAAAGEAAPMDLFRYTSAGTRTFSNTGDDAWFSYDGGVTRLVQYNMDSAGDYGDFHISNVARVQDAFGTPGTTENLGVELTMLDVVGYTFAVPEPNTATTLIAGLGLFAISLPRRRRP